MKKIIFRLMTFLFLVISIFSITLFKVDASNDEISVKLEQQEDTTKDKIRYVCTISNCLDLSSINSITVNLFIYKYGEGSKTATDSITKVYESISGANGKSSQDNTYYAVYILNDLTAYFNDYTLTVSFTISLTSKDIETNQISYTIGDNTDTFFMGMDTSCVPALENAGVKYRDDNGNVEDVFRVLADHGVNYIRVRVWNDPYYTDSNNVKYGYGGGNCDLDNAIAIGKRANKYGMKLLVDFHYSDFWADPEKQTLPKAWAGYSDSEIEAAIYDFTKASLTEMKDAGIDVGMVQVGNETNDALCGHMGDSSMEAICSFFSKGSKAVREVYPSALVAVHFANPSNYDTYLWYASELNKYSVDYDVFGTSYYPYWHGSLSNLSSLLSTIATNYNKKVCVLETAYANTEEYTDSRSDGYNNTVYTREKELSDDTNSALPYEFSVDGQKNALLGLIDTIKNKTTNGLGIFYWEGTWIKTPSSSASVTDSYSSDSEVYGTGWGNKYAYYYDSGHYSYENGGCSIENEAFFDENGNPFESLDVFMTDVSKTIVRSKDGYASSTLSNKSFEKGKLDGWTTSGDGKVNVKTTADDGNGEASDGSYGLSFGSDSSYTFDVSQDISYYTRGTYTFTLDVMGNTETNARIYAKVNGVEVSTTQASLTGWDNWVTYSVSFSADFTDTVEVGFHIESSGVWGYVDNATLTKTSDLVVKNQIENGTFEESTISGWTLTENATLETKVIVTGTGSNNKTGMFNFYSASADSIDFSLSQDVSGNAGKLSVSFEISGGNYTDCEIYAYISVNNNVTKGETLTALTDWDNWHTVSVENVDVDSSDTVIIGIYVKVPDAGGWGDIDNAVLTLS